MTGARVAGVAAALVLLAACSGGMSQPKTDTGEALAQVRKQVDGQRQCAPLLSGSAPIEFSADALSGPKVNALVAAGLVRRTPLPATGDRPRVGIEPTSTGRRDIWLRRLDPASPAEPFLCYGRKQVVAVHPGGKDTLRYDYRIVQPPAWTQRADIRAAFPFLMRALDTLHKAEQVATYEQGHWVVTGNTGPDAGAELPPSEGFFP